MKIKGVKIEDYKNIRFVELQLDETYNIISGKNGAGKTSLIEAMIAALKGKKYIGKKPSQKIRNGAEKSKVTVELDDLVVTRTITKKDVYLKAEKKDGSSVTQTDLDKIFGETTIDVGNLITMNPKEQVEFVKAISGIDTSKVEEEYKELYEERTYINRKLKDAEGAIAVLGDVEEVEPVDVTELSRELDEAMEHNRNVESAKRNIDNLESKAIAIKNKIKELEEALKKEKAALKLTEKELDNARKDADKAGDVIPIEPIREKLKNAAEVNKKAEKYETYKKAKEDAEKLKKESQELTKKLKEKLDERSKLINSGKLPFKNVELSKDDGLVIGGIPFSEMSTAQKIRAISKLYVHKNPELRVIYIQDGSLLDQDTIKEIEEISELNDFQFLIEVVNEVDGTIIMREGKIAGEEDDEDLEEL